MGSKMLANPKTAASKAVERHSLSNQKKPVVTGFLEERVGFEPTKRSSRSAVFKCGGLRDILCKRVSRSLLFGHFLHSP
jgi:hypothetical protein